LKSFDKFLLFNNLLRFGVNIDVRYIVDLLGACRIIKRRDIFVNKNVEWRQASNHQSVAVAAETLLEDGSQFALSVWNVVKFLALRLLLGIFGQR